MIVKRKRLIAFVLSVMVLASCHKSFYITQQSASSYKVKDISPDTNLIRLISPYKEGLDKKMDEVIGIAGMQLTKQQPESTLGNLVADAQLMAAQKINASVEASVANQGGMRLQYLNQGEITQRMMYELMPFDNTLTIVERPGSVLKVFCNHMASANGWPVSGISYLIKDKKAKNIMINNKPLNEQAIYIIAINDYLAGGGDNCSFLQPLKKQSTNIFVRDALIGYIRSITAQNKSLFIPLQKRVAYDE